MKEQKVQVGERVFIRINGRVIPHTVIAVEDGQVKCLAYRGSRSWRTRFTLDEFVQFKREEQ